MSIQSYTFAGFLFAVIFLYRLLPAKAFTLKRVALLMANLSFYALFGIRSVLCVLLFAGISWIGARFRKRGISPAIFLLLLLWIAQKGSGWYLLGISFYALQAIGYLLDVKQDKFPAERNFFSFLLTLSFFPVSLQGPICHYTELRAQMNTKTATAFSTELPAAPVSDSSAHPLADTPARIPLTDPDALPRILFGFFKKLVIADRIALLTGPLFRQPEIAAGPYVLLALLAYTIQLYADFTGGIDIALGTARSLGFALPENFRNPFAARSLADYWRRWHITLGTWFKEYVFYPLSFSPFWDKFHLSPKGILYLSTLLTWCLTGLWHGLSLRFLLWGLANGILLLLEQRFNRKKTQTHGQTKPTSAPQADGQLPQTHGRFSGFPAMAGVFLTTSLLRAFDCYPTAGTALAQLGSILSPAAWNAAITGGTAYGAGLLAGFTLSDLLLLLAALPFSLLIRRLRESKISWQNQIAVSLLLSATLLFGIYGRGYDATGFIYGNFV